MTLARQSSARPGTEPRLLARLLPLGRPAVMGVLNVTPDSFSDGGRFIEPPTAIEQARRIVAEGADILDIGAESTRPYGGTVPVPIEEEIRRLAPVLPAAVALGAPVSIDTMKAKVAAWALASGAAIVNDVWGLQRHRPAPRMRGLLRAGDHHAQPRKRRSVNRHHGGHRGVFLPLLDIAAGAGIAPHNIVLDPGIGFGKTPEQSITAIARLAELKSFGLPPWSAPRASASSTEFCPPHPTAAWADRSPPISSR